MTDKPKTSPQETLGTLYAKIQQKQVLTPEEEDAFRKKALEKYGGLPGLLKKQKELVSGDTRRELKELLDGLPNGDMILSKLDPLLPSKERVVEVAKEGVATVKGAAEQGVKVAGEMIPKGTAESVQKVGQELMTEGSKAGTQVAAAVGGIVSATSVDGMSGGIKKLSEAIDSVSGNLATALKSVKEMLSGFISMLGLDKLWKSLAGLFGMDTTQTASKDKKDETKPAETAVRTVQEGLKDAPEKAKEKLELVKNKYWEMLVSKGWITDAAGQKSKFEALWKSKALEIEARLKNVSTAVIEGKEWNLLTDIFEPGTIGPMKFLLELVTHGVIPSQAIFSAVGDVMSKSIKIGLQGAESAIRGTPSETMKLIGAFSSSDIDSLKPAEKAVLLASVHHNMGMMLSLAGKFSLALGSLSLMGLYWDQGSGIIRAKAFGNSFIGDFEAAGKNLDDMLKMLGDVDPNSPAREVFKQMREPLRQVQLKSTTTAMYLEMKKAGKLDINIADDLEKLMVGVEGKSHPFHGLSPDSQKHFQSMVASFRTGQGESKLVNYLESPSLSSTQTSISQIVQRSRSVAGWNPAEVRITDTIHQAENVGKSLANVVKNKDFSLMKFFHQVPLGMKFEQFVESVDKGVLPIIAKDHNQAKSIMERFIRAIPSGFDHFFSSLAITLTIAHVSSSDEKLKTLGQDILMMNPFFGGYILIKEGSEVKDNMLTKGGYLIAGGTITAIGVLQLSKVIGASSAGARSAALLDLTLGPVATFGRGMLALSRGVSYSALLAQNIAKPGALNSFGHARAFGSYLMVAAIIGYFAYGKYSEETEHKLLTDKGILKPDGNLDMAKLKETFMTLPEDKRSSLLENILNGSLGPYGISTSVKKGGNETVVHSDNVAKGVAPIPLDFFEMIANTMKEIGVGDGKTYLSTNATESTKKFIAGLPISEEKRSEFYAKFGIKA